MQPSSDRMADLASDQGYNSMGNLSPGGAGNSQTSMANITAAFARLRDAVKCGDHVLIYICGHGHPDGGIAITNSAGSLQEWLLPSDLANLLGTIPPCKDQDCNLPQHCCHVSVVIESCFSDNFNIPGVTGEGRSVSGSSTGTECWLTFAGGGVYTQGFDEDLRDPDSDTDDPPDGVDPVEAQSSAAAAVNAHPQSQRLGQQPWNSNQWCECKCPCQPDIDVEKWIWFDPYGWVDEVEVPLDQAITFRLDIENDGTCRDIIDLEIVDVLDGCLQYAGDAVLYHNGLPLGYRPPNSIEQVTGGTKLTWVLPESEIGALSPGDSLTIEYWAYVVEPGVNLNTIFGSAHCSYNYNNIVTDQDYVTIWVTGGEEIPTTPQEVLYGYLYAPTICNCYNYECTGCDTTIFFYAQDKTQGSYPITYVALYIGPQLYNSWQLNTAYFEYTTPPIAVSCNTITNVTLVIRNSMWEVIGELTLSLSPPIDTTYFCQTP